MKSIIKSIIKPILLIISYIIYAFACLRKKWILSHSLQSFPVPIIVVGNLTMGGSGKTPFVCALVEVLKNKGYKPGVVSRGYKGKKSSTIPYVLAPIDKQNAKDSGDEPLLIAQSTQVPVVIGKKRPKAVECLLAHYPDVNIIISDDGLQHYYLHRDIEIVLLNANCTNRALFPAGPFREPVSRLKTVDFVIGSQSSLVALQSSVLSYSVTQTLDDTLHLLNNSKINKSLSSLAGQRVYAVAGIAYPERFFQDLKKHNIDIIECPFKDHYVYSQADWQQLVEHAKQYPVVMTQKDAVKFKEYPEAINNIWVVSLVTHLPDVLVEKLMDRITQMSSH